jgi:ABC-type branched-subunit amino acid transport system ATPase component/L-rhamnose mutarotase
LEFVLNLFLDTLNKIIIFGLECCVMGDLKPIAKNRYGFFEHINLDFVNKGQGKIICLTGTNGTGKTQILSHIESVKRKETIFSSTMINIQSEKQELDDFIKDLIEDLGIKNVTDLDNALFAEDSFEYNNRNEYIKKIINKIKEINNVSVNNFKNYFGQLNEDQIDSIHKTLYKNYYRKKYNLQRIKQKRQDIYHTNDKTSIMIMLDEYQALYNEEYNKGYNKLVENIINNLKANELKNYEDFIKKLNDEIFSEIDINNLIQELGAKILDDYKETDKKRNYNETMFYKMNKELEANKEFFLYKLVEPKTNLKSYDLQFKYQDNELQNKGVISFDYLSTGEKQIFILIVYKYLLIPKGKNKTIKYKYLLLDEFDANLNPALINFYVKTLKDIIENNKEIRLIITTHSALTLRSFQLNNLFNEKKNEDNDEKDKKAELYEIKKDTKNKTHKCKKISENIIGDFILEYSDKLLEKIIQEKILEDKDLIDKAKYIIIVEGKDDKEYIEKYCKYVNKNNTNYDFYIKTANGGSDKVQKCLLDLDKYYKKDELALSNKKVILLYDFDQAGYDSGLKPCINGTKVDTFIANTKIGNLKDWNLNNIKKENILAMMLEPIKEEDFKNDIIKTYHYSNNIDKMLKKTVLDFEIEDLIVAYNVDKYKEFLEENKQYSFDIEKFFNIDRGNTCKKSVNKFFEDEEKHKYEDFNFAGFDELFKRIEANFKV